MSAYDPKRTSSPFYGVILCLFLADLMEVTVDRRSFLATLGLLAWRPDYAAAQSVPKRARIGWLTAQREASLTPYVKAMRESLAELGYVEEKI